MRTGVLEALASVIFCDEDTILLAKEMGKAGEGY